MSTTKELLDILFSTLNGHLSYLPSETPDDKLTGNRRMQMNPTTMGRCVVGEAEAVGMNRTDDPTTFMVIAKQNYTALSAITPPIQDVAIISILRAAIAVRGFMMDGRKARFCRTTEINVDSSYHTVDPALKGTNLNDDYAFMLLPENVMKHIPAMATLLPIFASLNFQKTNHHYIDNPETIQAYKNNFKSALQLEAEPIFNKAHIIYMSVHWMGPANMLYYYQNLQRLSPLSIPRGIVLKLNPTPAGVAVVSSQLAVWQTIKSFPAADILNEKYATELALLEELDALIKTDRLSYHVFSALYGKRPLIDDPGFRKRIEQIVPLCAIAQAFLETVAVGTDLARMKALKKHSDANLGLFKIASAAFKNAMKGVNKESSLENLKGEANPKLEFPALMAPGPAKVYDIDDFDAYTDVLSKMRLYSDDTIETIPIAKGPEPKPTKVVKVAAPTATTTTTTTETTPIEPAKKT